MNENDPKHKYKIMTNWLKVQSIDFCLARPNLQAGHKIVLI